MSGKGYIKLYRQIQDCWIWFADEKFSKAQAWVDLLMLANHSDKKIYFNGEVINIERGQNLTSIRALSERWGWSKDSVSRFLKLLENDGMITKICDTHRTLITVMNYEVFQCSETEDETPNGQEQGHDTDTDKDTGETQIGTNNKLKNDNKNDNKNNIYIAHFEEAWKIYPKKKDKSRAFQCYMARINSGYSEDELLTATKNYAAECEKDGRPEKYIKNGSTFFGINEPFVDYLGERKSTPVNGIMEYEIDNGDTHPQIPPYYGFPKEWFDGDDPVRDRFVKVKQVRNFSIGVTDDTIYSPDELWDKFILRKRGYEYEQQFGFNDCP